MGLAVQLLKADFAKIQDIAIFIGNLVSAKPALHHSFGFIKPLEAFRTGQLCLHDNKYEAVVPLYPDVREEIRRWTKESIFKPKSLLTSASETDVFTDAAKLGWGAVWGERRENRHWSVVEQELHINIRELMALYFAWKMFAAFNGATHVTFHTDSSTVVSLFKNQGSMVHFLHYCRARQKPQKRKRSKKQRITRGPISTTAAEKESATAECPGEATRRLGLEVFSPNGEWSLDSKIVSLLAERFGTPEVDLFASRLNFKFKKFCSWSPDPLAWKVDALAHTSFREFYESSPGPGN
uniref:RNase H type-1 domain-containing protein n=1 Tax=Strigamia maritima TaxID=126957 RepID=T1IKL4_STRMM